MAPKLINKREVARLFGVTTRTIERWLKDGKLPQPKTRFRLKRWDYQELVALLKHKSK